MEFIFQNSIYHKEYTHYVISNASKAPTSRNLISEMAFGITYP